MRMQFFSCTSVSCSSSFLGYPPSSWETGQGGRGQTSYGGGCFTCLPSESSPFRPGLVSTVHSLFCSHGCASKQVSLHTRAVSLSTGSRVFFTTKRLFGSSPSSTRRSGYSWPGRGGAIPLAPASMEKATPNTSLKRRRTTARHLAREALTVYPALRGPGAAPMRAA